MDINTSLDLNVVAVENQDRVSVLLELVAPTRDADQTRPPGTLEVVLDRSGSMGDGRLVAAQRAIESLIDRLDPSDNFGLVVFDDQAQVIVPAGPLTDKAAAVAAVRSLHLGSMTNLSGGYLRGIQEARRVVGEDGSGTLLLVSDGHANCGVTDHAQLADLATGGRQHDLTTSTVGVGLGFDEELMGVLARGGGGTARFGEEADEAGAAMTAEVEDLLEQSAQAAHLTVRPSGEVSAVTLLNDLPATVIEDGFMVDLGDLYSGEHRRLVLEIEVPAIDGLGLAQVCELELGWVDVSEMKSEKVTLPVHVNVVPGDQAAGRIPDPIVVSERLFQEAQRAKKEAGEALRQGDRDRASHIWMTAKESLDAAIPAASPETRDELSKESALLGDMADRATHDDARLLSKQTENDRFFKSSRRGRRGG